MRHTLLAAALLAAPSVALAQQPAAQQPAPDRACLRNQEIQSSMPAKDEKSITFTMRNGDKWRGDLGSRCAGIRFSGFVWEIMSDGQICARSQTLRVREGGPVCVLRSLTKLPSTTN
ncbi:MAG: hypothetical protein BGN82_05095 [Alphaproteobacteria bacterium 65-7]|nr:MAG: hypothetical protein BGN82_05095 [Alphaproteobacteria bacterium 65-7]